LAEESSSNDSSQVTDNIPTDRREVLIEYRAGFHFAKASSPGFPWVFVAQ